MQVSNTKLLQIPEQPPCLLSFLTASHSELFYFLALFNFAKTFFTSFAIISLVTLKDPFSISSQLHCFSIDTETGDNSVSAVHLDVF